MRAFLIYMTFLCSAHQVCAQKTFMLDTTGYLPPIRFQAENENTCYGHSLLYNMLSYSVSSSSNRKHMFSPCYNYSPDQKRAGISTEDLMKSVERKGLLEISKRKDDICGDQVKIPEDDSSSSIIRDYYLTKKGTNKDITNGIKEILKEEGIGAVLAYSVATSKNMDIFNNDIHYVKFRDCLPADNCSGYNHVVFCLGYDDNIVLGDSKGGFLVRDSDRRGEKNTKKELWIPYTEIKKLKKSEVFYLTKLNGERRFPANTIIYGDNKKDIYWLGKPRRWLKNGKKKYYSERYDDFVVVLLKLSFIGKEATIGIKPDRNHKKIAEFTLKPGETTSFLINGVWREFHYKNKSFNKGKMWWYPEINYSIKTQNN